MAELGDLIRLNNTSDQCQKTMFDLIIWKIQKVRIGIHVPVLDGKITALITAHWIILIHDLVHILIEVSQQTNQTF